MTTQRATDLALRHRRIGWGSLLVFLLLGLVLEGLHGFKVRFYLDVSNEVRRHLWTLAHAHGALIALVHLAFASAVVAGSGRTGRDGRGGLAEAPSLRARTTGIASAALTAAGVLLPGGFLLGGAVIHGGDPGLGILLVPIGAVALTLAVGCTAWTQIRGD